MDTWIFYIIVVSLVIVREISGKVFFILFTIVLIMVLQSDDFSLFSWDVLPLAAHRFIDPLYSAINN